jgi:rfaE bifunctional protein nucleotidyltransferase chain/domain
MLREKVVGSAELDRAVARLPRPLVFTNGVFDILHRGHVTYLEEARALGESLIVGLNSDASVRLLAKGEDRPIIKEEDRAIMLAALQSVSLVTMFEEATPLQLLARVRPDIYVKGGDYDVAALPEAELIQSWGGRALALPFVDGFSTTAFLARVRGGR